jgi:Leucine-rich repeat (LRR) protein
MPSLVTIDLCGCLKLENLPLLANMSLSEESIDVIYASAENFDLSSDELISFYYLNSLIFLDLSFCNLSTVPDAIGELRHLERLNLVRKQPSMRRLSSQSGIFKLGTLQQASIFA